MEMGQANQKLASCYFQSVCDRINQEAGKTTEGTTQERLLNDCPQRQFV